MARSESVSSFIPPVWANIYHDGFDIIAFCTFSNSSPCGIFLLDCAALVVIQILDLSPCRGCPIDLLFQPFNDACGVSSGAIACLTDALELFIFSPSKVELSRKVNYTWDLAALVELDEWHSSLSHRNMKMAWSVQGPLLVANQALSVWMPNAGFEPKNNKFGNAAIVLKWSKRENLQSACTYAAASPGGCMFVTAHEDSNDLSVWVRTILEQDKWIYTIEGCLSHANQVTNISWHRCPDDLQQLVLTIDSVGATRIWQQRPNDAPTEDQHPSMRNSISPKGVVFLEAARLEPTFSRSTSLQAACFLHTSYFGTRRCELVGAQLSSVHYPSFSKKGSWTKSFESDNHSASCKVCGDASKLEVSGTWLTGSADDGVLRLWRLKDIMMPDGSRKPEPVECGALPISRLLGSTKMTKLSGTCLVHSDDMCAPRELRIMTFCENEGENDNHSLAILTATITAQCALGKHRFSDVRIVTVPFCARTLERSKQGAAHPYLPLICSLHSNGEILMQSFLNENFTRTKVLNPTLVPYVLPSIKPSNCEIMGNGQTKAENEVLHLSWLTDQTCFDDGSPALLVIRSGGEIEILELQEGIEAGMNGLNGQNCTVRGGTISDLLQCKSIIRSPFRVPSSPESSKSSRSFQQSNGTHIDEAFHQMGRHEGKNCNITAQPGPPCEISIGLRMVDDEGLGLILEFTKEGVIVSGFNAHSVTGEMLPAEASGKIHKNDKIIEVNGQCLDGLEPDDAAFVVQNARMFSQGDIMNLVVCPSTNTSTSKNDIAPGIERSLSREESPPPVTGWYRVERNRNSSKGHRSLRVSRRLTETNPQNLQWVSLGTGALQSTLSYIISIPCPRRVNIETDVVMEHPVLWEEMACLPPDTTHSCIILCFGAQIDISDPDSKSEIIAMYVNWTEEDGLTTSEYCRIDANPNIFPNKSFSANVTACGNITTSAFTLCMDGYIRKWSVLHDDDDYCNWSIHFSEICCPFEMLVVTDVQICVSAGSYVAVSGKISNSKEVKLELWKQSEQCYPSTEYEIDCKMEIHVEDGYIEDIFWVSFREENNFEYLNHSGCFAVALQSKILVIKKESNREWKVIIELANPCILLSLNSTNSLKAYVYACLTSDLNVIGNLHNGCSVVTEKYKPLSEWYPLSLVAQYCVSLQIYTNKLDSFFETLKWAFDLLPIGFNSNFGSAVPLSLLAGNSDISKSTEMFEFVWTLLKYLSTRVSWPPSCLEKLENAKATIKPLPPRISSFSSHELLAMWAVIETVLHENVLPSALLPSVGKIVADSVENADANKNIFSFDALFKKLKESSRAPISKQKIEFSDSFAATYMFALGVQTRLSQWDPLRFHKSSTPQNFPCMASSAVVAMLLCSETGDQKTVLDLFLTATLGWDSARKARIPFWLKADSQLIRASEAIAAATYRSTKNIMAAAVHYIAIGREKTLLALAKADRPHPLARPLSGAEQSIGGGIGMGPTAGQRLEKLLDHDFKSTSGRLTAERNAYALLRKRNYLAAAAVFLLPRPAMLKEAIQIIMIHLKDPALALYLTRLIQIRDSNLNFNTDGPNSNPVRDLIQREFLPFFSKKNSENFDPFLEVASLLWIDENQRAFDALLSIRTPNIENFSNDNMLSSINNILDVVTYPSLVQRMKALNNVTKLPYWIEQSARLSSAQELLKIGMKLPAIGILGTETDIKIGSKDEIPATVESNELPIREIASTKSAFEGGIFGDFDMPNKSFTRRENKSNHFDSGELSDSFGSFAPAPPKKIPNVTVHDSDPFQGGIFDSFDAPRPQKSKSQAFVASGELDGGIFGDFNAAPQRKAQSFMSSNPAATDQSNRDIFSDFDTPSQRMSPPKPANLTSLAAPSILKKAASLPEFSWENFDRELESRFTQSWLKAKMSSDHTEVNKYVKRLRNEFSALALASRLLEEVQSSLLGTSSEQPLVTAMNKALGMFKKEGILEPITCVVEGAKVLHNLYGAIDEFSLVNLSTSLYKAEHTHPSFAVFFVLLRAAKRLSALNNEVCKLSRAIIGYGSAHIQLHGASKNLERFKNFIRKEAFQLQMCLTLSEYDGYHALSLRAQLEVSAGFRAGLFLSGYDSTYDISKALIDTPVEVPVINSLFFAGLDIESHSRNALLLGECATKDEIILKDILRRKFPELASKEALFGDMYGHYSVISKFDAERVLVQKSPGSFILRPVDTKFEDILSSFCLSVATKGMNNDLSYVCHATIWSFYLNDDNSESDDESTFENSNNLNILFRSGVIGPFESVHKLLDSISTILPMGLNFDESVQQILSMDSNHLNKSLVEPMKHFSNSRLLSVLECVNSSDEYQHPSENELCLDGMWALHGRLACVLDMLSLRYEHRHLSEISSGLDWGTCFRARAPLPSRCLGFIPLALQELLEPSNPLNSTDSKFVLSPTPPSIRHAGSFGSDDGPLHTPLVIYLQPLYIWAQSLDRQFYAYLYRPYTNSEGIIPPMIVSYVLPKILDQDQKQAYHSESNSLKQRFHWQPWNKDLKPLVDHEKFDFGDDERVAITMMQGHNAGGVQVYMVRICQDKRSPEVPCIFENDAKAWMVTRGVHSNLNAAERRIKALCECRILRQVSNWYHIGGSDHQKDRLLRWVDRWEIEPLNRGCMFEGRALGRAWYRSMAEADTEKFRTLDEIRSYLGHSAAALWLQLGGKAWLIRLSTTSGLPFSRLHRKCDVGDTSLGTDVLEYDSRYVTNKPTGEICDVTSSILAQGRDPFSSCLFEHLVRNCSFSNLSLPHRFVAILQVELQDLKNLSPYFAPSPMDVFAVARLHRGHFIQTSHKHPTLGSAVTGVNRVIPSAEAKASRQWGGSLLFRFALPEDLLPLIREKGAKALPNAMLNQNGSPGPPNILQVVVYRKSFISEDSIGSVDVPIHCLTNEITINEWYPLKRSKNTRLWKTMSSAVHSGGAAWFLNLKISLRFVIMLLSGPNSDEDGEYETFNSSFHLKNAASAMMMNEGDHIL